MKHTRVVEEINRIRHPSYAAFLFYYLDLKATITVGRQAERVLGRQRQAASFGGRHCNSAAWISNIISQAIGKEKITIDAQVGHYCFQPAGPN